MLFWFTWLGILIACEAGICYSSYATWLKVLLAVFAPYILGNIHFWCKKQGIFEKTDDPPVV